MIAFLPATAADDAALMTAVTDLANAVYRESERGLWADGATRTDEAEVAALTRAGELVAARRDGRPARAGGPDRGLHPHLATGADVRHYVERLV